MIAKICGLRTADAALVAAEAGADYLGFILAPSKRQVTIETIAEIRASLQAALAETPPIVGVVVNPSREELDAIVRSGAVDVVQFSGEEDVAIVEGLTVPYIKALRAQPDESAADVLARISAWTSLAQPPVAILLDAYHPGVYGGSGVTGDWAIAAEVARETPILLAGGLTPENVAWAITSVHPFGVDVASGVETDGVKDPVRIRAFLAAARASQPQPRASVGS